MFAKKIAYSFVVLSSLTHIFCCGVPLFMSLTSLTVSLGMTSGELGHFMWFEEVKYHVLAFSGAILLVTGLLQYISNRIDCRTDGACVHEPCDGKKDFSKIIFKVAIVLYAMNLLVALFTGHAAH